jgi:dTDP-4-dehydrorhamnose 3,5-epimerase-like enzyme
MRGGLHVTPPAGVSIEGLDLRPLQAFTDARGSLVEFYRAEWSGAPALQQFNWVRTRGRSLRGVHIHARHSDWLMVIGGSMRIGLHDCRPDSPSFRSQGMVDLAEECPAVLMIPPGVGHGFYTEAPATFIYGMTHCWRPDDDLVVRWDDPDLNLDWRCSDPDLSERDRAGLPLSAALSRMHSGFADACESA